MQIDNLYKLGLYLQKSKKAQEYLTFDEIEKIIGTTLSDKAKTPYWWYNDCRKKQAQIWLSNGFKTIDAGTIPMRKGVTFKKYEQNTKNKIIYSRKIVQIFSYFIIPVLVALTASFLFSIISKEVKLTNSLQKVDMYYAMNEVNKTEELIFEIIPELEQRKDSDTLCTLYNILFELRYNKYVEDDDLLNSDELEKITQACLRGLESADNIYYSIIFNNHLGKLYKYQYDKSFNIEDAYSALEYFIQADKAYVRIGDGIKPVLKDFESQEDVNIAFAGLETNIEIFELYYLMIQNGEFSTKDFDLTNASDEQQLSNKFYRLFQYMKIVTSIDSYIYRQISNTDFKYDYNSEMFFRGINVYGRCMCLFYVLSEKYDADILMDRNNYTFSKVKNILMWTRQIAINAQQFDTLAYIYFDLARISYINCIIHEDLSSFSDLELYFMNWMELAGKKSISLREMDRCFFNITEGELLDCYLIESEDVLKNLSFASNPSFFAYTNFELGKHYYYKAVELIKQNDSDDHITERLVRALDCCFSALMYYGDNSSSQIFNEIELLISEITYTYDNLSIQK